MPFGARGKAFSRARNGRSNEPKRQDLRDYHLTKRWIFIGDDFGRRHFPHRSRRVGGINLLQAVSVLALSVLLLFMVPITAPALSSGKSGVEEATHSFSDDVMERSIVELTSKSIPPTGESVHPSLTASEEAVVLEASSYPGDGTLWYLAEGCTAAGMQTYILVQNPVRIPPTSSSPSRPGRGRFRDPRWTLREVGGPPSSPTNTFPEIPTSPPRWNRISR